jgi:NADPH-dependent curcumin reductase CurA
MPTPSHYTQIVLNERPVGEIQPNTFRSETLPFDLKPADDQVLVQVTWLSLDPAMRIYLNAAGGYMPPVRIGEKMRTYGLAVVLQAGTGSKFNVGDVVRGSWGQ